MITIILRRQPSWPREATGSFARGLIHAPFKVGKPSEPTQVLQLMGEGKIAGRYVLDTSVSSVIYQRPIFQSSITPFM